MIRLIFATISISINLYLVSGQASFPPATGCPAEFKSRCKCGVVPYGSSGRPIFVTNCTNANFTDVSMLTQLPIETEVLVLTGNNVTSLPANLLGQDADYDKLHTIDLSNNNIKYIRGKTFHNVKSVRILNLSFNEIVMDDDNFHPRLFSNFENLEELHLRNAFGSSEKSEDFMKHLTTTFAESQLETLKLLNLEYNYIRTLYNPVMFCFLPKLQKLNLAHNLLSNFHLNLTCLKDLNLVDLSNNYITTVHNESIAYFETGPRYYHLNISNNPFRCDCRMQDFLTWVNTAIEVRINAPETLYCYTGNPMDVAGRYFDEISTLDIPCSRVQNDDLSPNFYISFSYAILTCLLVILFILLTTLIYLNRDYVTNATRFVITNIAGKREYTSLEKQSKRHQQHVNQEIAEVVV